MKPSERRYPCFLDPRPWSSKPPPCILQSSYHAKDVIFLSTSADFSRFPTFRANSGDKPQNFVFSNLFDASLYAGLYGCRTTLEAEFRLFHFPLALHAYVGADETRLLRLIPQIAIMSRDPIVQALQKFTRYEILHIELTILAKVQDLNIIQLRRRRRATQIEPSSWWIPSQSVRDHPLCLYIIGTCRYPMFY